MCSGRLILLKPKFKKKIVIDLPSASYDVPESKHYLESRVSTVGHFIMQRTSRSLSIH